MTAMPPSPDVLPNYHFLVIAPNLGAEWLFDAARQYWERFRPIVASDLELVRLLAPNYAVIVTVVARRDTVSQWGVAMAQVAPQALFDPVVQDLFDDMRTALNARAQLNQPFGVPLIPSPLPPTPISPTPGPLIIGGPAPTRAPAGFVTATPSAPLAPAPAAPDPAQPPPQPVYPTPGPVTGGGA